MFNKNNFFKPFDKKIWLSSPTMHGDELKYIQEAYDLNWMSTIGENINEVERIAAKKSGVNYAVGLSSCTAALHLCVKLAGERVYGKAKLGEGVLAGKRVFCSDMTFEATVNPIVYEGGIPVFIDTNPKNWNMDADALEKAFEIYPDVKIVMYAELYGFSGDVARIKKICEDHGALLIEDAAEALGTTWGERPCGSFGDYGAVSYNGNKIITGSSGGCFLTNSLGDAEAVRKWSTQSREQAPWYQHIQLGYNYRMSNVIAGVVRGQYNYLEEHIAQKKAIYERYKEAFKDLPIQMNPFNCEECSPNYWLSAFVINKEAMSKQERGDLSVTYEQEQGKTCPSEILDALSSINAEGRPIWKPMHMQPYYYATDYISINGLVDRADRNARNIGADIFDRGLCLPSDNKMTEEQQNYIIDVVKACFE